MADSVVPLHMLPRRCSLPICITAMSNLGLNGPRSSCYFPGFPANVVSSYRSWFHRLTVTEELLRSKHFEEKLECIRELPARFISELRACHLISFSTTGTGSDISSPFAREPDLGVMDPESSLRSTREYPPARSSPHGFASHLIYLVTESEVDQC